MRITTLLMKPLLQQLEQDFSALLNEVLNQTHPSDELHDFWKAIESKKREAGRLRNIFAEMDGTHQALVPAELYDAFRQNKLDLRFLRRGWMRVLSNRERLKKMDARRMHVSTFAA